MADDQGQVVGVGIFDLLLRKAKFKQDLNESEQDFKQTVGRMAQSAASLQTVLLGAIGAGFLTMVDQSVKKLVEMGEQIKSLKGQFGATAEETSTFVQLAERAGVNVGLLARGMRMLQFQIDATTKAVHATDTRLGGMLGTIRNVHGQVLTTTEVFKLVSEKVQHAKSATEAASVANDAFGRMMGTRLLPILRQGPEAFSEAAKEASRLGLMFSEDRIQQVRKYAIAQHELKERFEALEVQLGSALLPVFTKYTEKIISTVEPLVVSLNAHKEWVSVLLQLGTLVAIPVALAGGISLLRVAVQFLQRNLPGLSAAIAQYKTRSAEALATTSAQTRVIQENTASLAANAAAARTAAGAQVGLSKAGAVSAETAATEVGLGGARFGLLGATVGQAVSSVFLIGMAAEVGNQIGQIIRDFQLGNVIGGESNKGFTVGDYVTFGTLGLEAVRRFASGDFQGAAAAYSAGAYEIRRTRAEKDAEAKREEEQRKAVEERQAEAETDKAVSKPFKEAEEAKKKGESFSEYRQKLSAAIEFAEGLREDVQGSANARLRATQARISLASEEVKVEQMRAAIGISSENEVLKRMQERLFLAQKLRGEGKDASELELQVQAQIVKQREKILQLREFELRAVGAFGEEQKLAQLEEQAAIELGDKKKKIEGEIFQLRKKLSNEAIKIEVELGLKTRQDMIQNNMTEVRRLFSTGQFTEAGNLLLQTRKLQMQEMQEQFDFEKSLREKSVDELMGFYKSKLEMVKGNATEERKILSEMAGEEKKVLQDRLKANLDFLDQVESGEKLTEKIVASPRESRLSAKQIRGEAETQETFNLDALMGAIQGGFDPSLRKEIVSAVQSRVSDIQSRRLRGDTTTSQQDQFYDRALKFLQELTGLSTIYDPRKGISVGSLPGALDSGLGTSVYSQIPTLGAEYSDMVRTWKDATSATIGSVSALKVALDSLSQKIAVIAGGVGLPAPAIPQQSFIGPGGVSNQGLVSPQQQPLISEVGPRSFVGFGRGDRGAAGEFNTGFTGVSGADMGMIARIQQNEIAIKQLENDIAKGGSSLPPIVVEVHPSDGFGDIVTAKVRQAAPGIVADHLQQSSLNQ